MTESGYSLDEIAAYTCSRLHGKPANGFINEILTDSRKLSAPQHTLFFALITPRNNGHRFIETLIAAGVKYFCVSQLPDKQPDDCVFFLVEDTLVALQKLVAAHRSRYAFPVIGITGSNGKTIVKEWLWQLLSPEKTIVRSPKSFNSQIGVPLSVWQMNQLHNLGIFEAGISQPGEMPQLEQIIQPEIGIFTHIGPAHDFYFDTLKQKIQEKLLLFKNVKTLIYCSDQPEVREEIQKSRLQAELFDWGRSENARLRITSVDITKVGTEIHALFNHKPLTITIPFTDEAAIENAIHCWAVMLLFGYGPDVTSGRMRKLQPVAMRLEMKEGVNGCSIINDAYSSDTDSLSIALDFLAQQNQHDKRTIILSDMLQGAANEAGLYQTIATHLSNKGIDRLIGIGPALKKYSNLFGMQKHFYPDTKSFIDDFDSRYFSNESILLKGARFYEFERINELLQQRSHETVLEVNLNALIHNLNYFRSLLQPQTKLMAMVKAFSYGSGSFEIANALQFHHADYLAVAYADEGMELRKAGISLPIMVMNPEDSGMESILRFNLEPEIYNFRSLRMLLRAMKVYGFSKENPVNIHIKLDTGMHRLGFEAHDIADLIRQLLKSPEIHVCSVFSHLVGSDNPELDEFTQQQIQRFDELTEELQIGVGYKFLKHILNSAGISRFPEAQFDMVRLGISLYGISGDDKEQQMLEAVSSLKTSISQIKILGINETVGYNRAWTSEKETIIATIPIGYADGLSRQLSNGRGKMWVNGQLAPVVGNICMDMTMLDITGIPASEGDEVIVFGGQLPISILAEAMQTIPYEVLTGISRRVKRVYFQE